MDKEAIEYLVNLANENGDLRRRVRELESEVKGLQSTLVEVEKRMREVNRNNVELESESIPNGGVGS